MTYKKYIKRNGKVYGPYLYESKRVNGKVISEYIGQGKEKQKRKIKNLPYLLIPLVLGFAFFIIFSGSGPFTGKAILSLNTINSSNTYTGNISLNLLKGELLPANSIIKIKNSNKTYILQLNQTLSEKTTNGTYYSKQIYLSSSGEGYGKMGTKLIPKTVFFKIKLISQNQKQINSTKANSTSSPQTDTNQNSSILPLANKTNITQNSSTNTSKSNSTNLTLTNSTNPTPSIKTNNSINSTKANSTSSPQTDTNQNPSILPLANKTNITQNPSTNTSKSNSTTAVKKQKASSTTQTSRNTTTPSTSKSNSTMVAQKNNASITGKIIASERNSNNLFNKVLGFFSKFSKQTGNAIKNNTIIQANTQIDAPYTYNLPSKTIAVLVPGSVSTQTTSLPDNSVTLTINSGKLTVTTNYSKIEKGFGKDFIENQSVPYIINLNKKNITLLPGKTTITLESQNKTILTFNQNIENTSINFTNLTQKIFNITQTNFTKNFLSLQEQKTLENQFGKNFTVLTNASKYRNKVIVTFTLGTYTISNTYSDNLTNEELKLDVKRDRSMWLKDISNSFSYSPQEIPLKNLSL